MPKPLEQNMGADALKAATGRDHDGWRTLLTDAGALDWSHSQIASFLMEQHDVPAWWAQGVTVDFEQACKGRLPGQRADGTFAVARTQTVPGERLDALAAIAAEVTRRHGDPHGRNLTANQPVVRWRLPDGTRLQAAAQPVNKSGTPINLTWEKLPDPSAMERATAEIAEIFTSTRG